jgi:ABC-type sulfate/molybdate transport systems ATPase subunit
VSERAVPLVELVGIAKQSPGMADLRIDRLAVSSGDRILLGGLDAGSAEALVHMITGALLPDEGEVRVGGRSTREIATDTEWLASLDRFGIVTERAVLLDAMSVAANLALPLTLAIDPLSAEVRQRIEGLAREVGLEAGRLDAPAGSLAPIERALVHLARALAVEPLMLLLEEPTRRLDPAAAARFGERLREAGEARRLAWMAVTNDAAFARASGGTRWRVADDGGVARGGFWRDLWTRSGR